jgi:hypothetical protein
MAIKKRPDNTKSRNFWGKALLALVLKLLINKLSKIRPVK